MIRSSSLFAFALATSGAAFASPVDTPRLAAVIGGENAADQPGCAAGIFSPERAPVIASVGLRDIVTRRPIDGDTQFYAASVSKQFTAIAIAQLVVAGRLKLDDDVHKFLPELADFGHRITVSMLLHHTSGIPDSLSLARLAGFADASDASRQDALRLLFNLKHANFIPGTRYEYSNGGYLLLSEIVSRVSGIPFPAYLADHVFKPLKMSRSYVLSGRGLDDPNAAHGYLLKDGAFVQRDTYPRYGGSGGVVLTINDLARYDRDLNVSRKIFTPEIEAIIGEPGRYENGSLVEDPTTGAVYGGGVWLGGDWISHSGSAEGFKTNYARTRDHSVGIALLCNRSDAGTILKTDRIIAAIGGLPSLNEHPFSDRPWLEGRFISASVPVVYTLHRTSYGLEVKVAAAPGGAPSGQSGFVLKAKWDASFVDETEAIKLTPMDSGDGFIIASGNLAVRFERAR